MITTRAVPALLPHITGVSPGPTSPLNDFADPLPGCGLASAVVPAEMGRSGQATSHWRSGLYGGGAFSCPHTPFSMAFPSKRPAELYAEHATRRFDGPAGWLTARPPP
jgi:hypothetical protein